MLVRQIDGKVALHIDQGASLNDELVYVDEVGAPIDLSGAGALCQIRQRKQSSSTLAELDVALTETGGITISASAGETADFDWSRPAFWDLLINMGSGSVRVVEGQAFLRPSVSREP